MDAHVGDTHGVVGTLIVLLGVAIATGLFVRRFRLPYTVALLVVGLALHGLGLVPEFHLTQELLMTALLPALLFEAAIHIPGKELARYAPSVALYAVPGVLLAVFVTALVLEVELTAFGVDAGLPVAQLILFGAMIAATDPISVVALFKQLGVEKKLAVLVEGESLFNDGTAVVVFGLVLEAIRTDSFSLSSGITKFLLVALGGMAIGAAVGLLASWATSLFDEHLIEIALTVITAYGAFLLAESIHVSGVLATVVAGLLVGNVGKKRGMSPHTRVSVLSFWEFFVFGINSLVFLLIGLEVDLGLLVSRVDIVVMAFVAVLVARALTVFAPLPLLRRMGQPANVAYSTVLWWGGLRGGLSMVLALALPASMPGRAEIITMTFGVVVLSIVLQGGTMGLLLKRLGLSLPRTEAMRFLGLRLARLKAIRAQQAALAELMTDRDLSAMGLSGLRARLEDERERLVRELDERREDEAFAEAARAHGDYLKDTLTEVARDSYRDSLDDNLINNREAAMLLAETEDEDPLSALDGPALRSETAPKPGER